jgi:hypothetical protein
VVRRSQVAPLVAMAETPASLEAGAVATVERRSRAMQGTRTAARS